MSDQNSEVMTQIWPEQAMEQLGLKRDAYYSDLKFLGIKAQKDSDDRSFLEEEQFQLLVALRQHVVTTGKREGFQAPGELARVCGNDLSGEGNEIPEEVPQQPEFDFAGIIAEAQELAGDRLTMREQVVSAIASQMGFEDLAPEIQEQVQSVRAAADPKAQVQEVASALLTQWRQQRATAAA
ncbi:MAG: hypothetical protein AAGH78_00560 [Cyanobacteria bacterium P01_H01_bin.58]